MQQRVYESRVNNVDELKQHLHDVWHGVQQDIIDLAVSQWRQRLRACVPNISTSEYWQKNWDLLDRASLSVCHWTHARRWYDCSGSSSSPFFLQGGWCICWIIIRLRNEQKHIYLFFSIARRSHIFQLLWEFSPCYIDQPQNKSTIYRSKFDKIRITMIRW